MEGWQSSCAPGPMLTCVHMQAYTHVHTYMQGGSTCPEGMSFSLTSLCAVSPDCRGKVIWCFHISGLETAFQISSHETLYIHFYICTHLTFRSISGAPTMSQILLWDPWMQHQLGSIPSSVCVSYFTMGPLSRQSRSCCPRTCSPCSPRTGTIHGT